MKRTKKLYRSARDKYLAGVCGGIAHYFNVDPVIIRLIFFIAAVMGGGGILAYLILSVVLPVKPFYTTFDAEASVVDEDPPESTSGSSNDDAEPRKARKAWSPAHVPKSNLIAGVALILVGAAFLAGNFIDSLKFSNLWPVVLIALGAIILLSSVKKSNENNHRHEL